MTLPAFKAAGTGSETSAAWPAGHAAGDFGLLFVNSTNNADNAFIDVPSGWIQLLALEASTANHVRLTVFYRFATSGAESNAALTCVNSVQYIWGTIITYTGVNTSTPFHARATQSHQSNVSQWLAGVATTLDDCMIVQVAAWNNDLAGPLFSGETNTTLGSLAERYDAGTTTGNGGGLGVWDGTLAIHGRCDPTAVTMSTGGALSAASLALQAADKTSVQLKQQTRVVNTGQ